MTVTVAQSRGRIAVIGTSYETRTGKILHSGRVELAGSLSSDTMLNRLADCLTGELCAEGVLPVSHPEYTPPPPPPSDPIDIAKLPSPAVERSMALPVSGNREPSAARPRRGWAKWLAAGGSAALLSLGGYVVNEARTRCGWNDPGCTTTTYDAVGYGALDVGVGLGALSLYWFLDLSPEKLPTRWLIGGGAAALAVGVSFYAVDQDPGHEDSTGSVARRYRDSARPGVALGVLGLASIGVGVWSWTRDTQPSSRPIVSLSSSRTVLGWGGEF